MKLRALVPAAALLLAACGGEDPTVGAPTTAPGPTVAPTTAAPAATGAVDAPPIEDAAALRDDLLRIAEENVTSEAGDALVPSFGVFEAWKQAYPELSFVGYAIEPDERTVPTYSNLLNAKELEGPENPYIIAFAILDTQGTCAGGVMVGYPSPDTFEAVDPDGEEQPCQPMALAAAGGYETFG
ncbi:MAG TPA: hypothetical protein VM638_09370 [Actinomycetota bacterium]|nr:hypothetical protein [Actinomycetota bacterium]